MNGRVCEWSCVIRVGHGRARAAAGGEGGSHAGAGQRPGLGARARALRSFSPSHLGAPADQQGGQEGGQGQRAAHGEEWSVCCKGAACVGRTDK